VGLSVMFMAATWSLRIFAPSIVSCRLVVFTGSSSPVKTNLPVFICCMSLLYAGCWVIA